MTERQRGEFFFPKELREQVDIPKAILLRLGKAGLLFAQAEAPYESGKPRHDNYTIFRYHLPYVAGAVAELDLGLLGDECDAQFMDYAAVRVDLMSSAMNRYYERIFVAAGDQRRPDGRPYLFRDQAGAAIDLSASKINRYCDQTDEVRPTWNPDRLARVFNWNIPGSPETVQQVRAQLGELATRYAQIMNRGGDNVG